MSSPETYTKYQTRIYDQCGICSNKNSVKNTYNTSSDMYVFNTPFFDVSGATKIDCTSPPNSGLTSGDTGVYIIGTETGITFTFTFTANTESFTDENQSKFRYDIHRYNGNIGSFNTTPIYSSDDIEWSSFSATSATTQTLKISDITLDGDYIIKGQYKNKYATEFGSALGIEYDTSLYNQSDEYGIYRADRDFYFVAMREADTPQPSLGTNLITAPDSFVVSSVSLVDGQTDIIVNATFNSYIVALNGLVLAETLDYIISGLTGNVVSTLIQLVSPAKTGDILTVTYINAGASNVIYGEVYDIINPIPSGPLNGQGSNDVYYNTTTNKYELYLTYDPISQNDILITLNGAVLANNIDYYQSTSNPKRIIFEGSILVGDIINAYYNTITNLVGQIVNPEPSFGWVITNAPINTDGTFTVEVSTTDTFTGVTTSGTVEYIAGETVYNLPLQLSGNYGDELYYRIKNEKRYYTLCDSIVNSIKYSEVIPIVLGINSTNNY